MNPESQRIAIAEARGFLRSERDGFWYWPHGFPTASSRPYAELFEFPDYLNDLNAMHEAEKVLDYYQQSEFVSRLSSKVSHGFNFCHATASQRAEAFLRTIGKWKEQPQEQLV